MTVTKIAKLLPIAGLACLLSLPAMAQTAPGAAPAAGSMAPMSSGTTAPDTMAPATTKHRKAGKRALIPSDERFTTASAAAAHCPNSVVEWATLSRSKAYHGSKSKYFGKTKHGVYACKPDLDAAGFHQAKN